VADLSRVPVPPHPDAPLEHEPAADARAEGDEQDMARSTPRTEPRFGESGGVGVVLRERRAAGAGLQLFAHLQPVEGGNVGRRAHAPFGQVDDARQPDTDGERRSPGLLEGLHRSRELAEDVGRGGLADRLVQARKHLAAGVDPRSFEKGAADVETDVRAVCHGHLRKLCPIQHLTGRRWAGEIR
jgi:hypothetical protein